MTPRQLRSRLAPTLLLIAASAHSDHVQWFSPQGARLTGAGAFTTPAVPEAVRISHPGGPPSQPGTVQVALSAPTNAVLDSVIICFRTVLQDPSPSRITGIRLRTVNTPTVATSVLTSMAILGSVSGTCLALDVPDQALTGAPVLALDYVLEPGTYLELGGIGLRYSTSTSAAITGPGAAGPSAIEFLAVRPNPSREGAQFDMRLAIGSRVDVSVFDVAGRRVRRVLESRLEPGERSVSWDGRDDAGRRVPAGVYMARVELAGSVAAERVVRIE